MMIIITIMIPAKQQGLVELVIYALRRVHGVVGRELVWLELQRTILLEPEPFEFHVTA